MAKFKCVAKATAQGTQGVWRVEANDEKEAMFLFTDKAIDHIESFDNPDVIAEETGCEYEYNYFVQQISDEEYEELEADNLI